MISPLLANIYLHYVYDLWVDQWRKREATGEVIVVRYADDMVVGFQYLADAERFLGELQAAAGGVRAWRCTRTRPGSSSSAASPVRTAVARGQGKPETFAFLGFTHICGKTREGRRLIRRHTIASG